MYISVMDSAFKSVKKPQGLIAFVCICSLLFCCKKSDPSSPYYETDTGDLRYTIDSLKDVSIERTGEKKQNLVISRISGTIEDVNLTVVGLPQGVTGSFEPVTSKPSFVSTLTIKAKRAIAGTYPLILRGSSLTSGFTERKFTLTILPYSNIALSLEGQFIENGLCSPSGAVGDTVEVVPFTSEANKINIKGIWSGVWSNMVYAELNPTDKTLSIPSQTVNGVTLSGSGSFTENVMIIGYRVKGTTVNDTCTSTFSRL